MREKKENLPTGERLLSTIIYRENEWSPELLQENVRNKYQYYEIPENMGESKYLGYPESFANVIKQQNMNSGNALFIAATDKSASMAKQMGVAVLGYAGGHRRHEEEIPLLAASCEWSNEYTSPTFAGIGMVVEGFEEVDELFLERVYERAHHIPWTIAQTSRWVLRELTMDDMDGLVELYKQPGVTYRIENGHKIPGYIEPLLPREEEEEYQRSYIENMYALYGYGMWLVTEPPEAGEESSYQTITPAKAAYRQSRIIGRAGLEHREYEDKVELEMGYVIHPGWQHRGIAYEVCSKIIEYAVQNTEFERLNALTEPDNTASIALLEKLGFTYLEQTEASGSLTWRYVYPLKGTAHGQKKDGQIRKL